MGVCCETDMRLRGKGTGPLGRLVNCVGVWGVAGVLGDLRARKAAGVGVVVVVKGVAGVLGAVDETGVGVVVVVKSVAGVLGAVDEAGVSVVAGVEGVGTCVGGGRCVPGVVKCVWAGVASCGCMKALVGVKVWTAALADEELRSRWSGRWRDGWEDTCCASLESVAGEGQACLGRECDLAGCDRGAGMGAGAGCSWRAGGV